MVRVMTLVYSLCMFYFIRVSFSPHVDFQCIPHRHKGMFSPSEFEDGYSFLKRSSTTNRNPLEMPKARYHTLGSMSFTIPFLVSYLQSDCRSMAGYCVPRHESSPSNLQSGLALAINDQLVVISSVHMDTQPISPCYCIQCSLRV